MEETSPCLICGHDAQMDTKNQRVDANTIRLDPDVLVNCPRCGEYELPAMEWNGLSRVVWSQEFRSALSCAARQASETGERLRITEENARTYSEAHVDTRVADNLDNLLRCIARHAPRPGSVVSFFTDTDFTLIDCYNSEEFRQYLHWLKTGGLLFSSGTLQQETFGLTVEGWNRVQPLPRPGGIPRRCFVAMWFSDVTKDAYDRGIEPGVIDAGFKPIRIDRKEHNNEIPDEIMAEIRDCQFMVADFTGQRHGVYYEAGFAVGLGRPVIYCCREDEVPKLHFDTNHKNHVVWTTPEELRDRLFKRIRVTIIEKG